MARPYLPTLFGRDGETIGSLFREVERAFDDFSRRSPFAGMTGAALTPRLDVSETKDAIEIKAELPGVDEKDVDVTLADGVLTIRGEKKSERDERDEEKNWHVVERSYGSFTRSIALPFDPESDKIEANFDKGVLHIRLPKPTEAVKKEQKIQIKKAEGTGGGKASRSEKGQAA